MMNLGDGILASVQNGGFVFIILSGILNERRAATPKVFVPIYKLNSVANSSVMQIPIVIS